MASDRIKRGIRSTVGGSKKPDHAQAAENIKKLMNDPSLSSEMKRHLKDLHTHLSTNVDSQHKIEQAKSSKTYRDTDQITGNVNPTDPPAPPPCRFFFFGVCWG